MIVTTKQMNNLCNDHACEKIEVKEAKNKKKK